MSTEKITLIIPTKDRSDFILRLLNYYSNTGFKGVLCIGDSSGSEHLPKVRKAVQTFQRKLNIQFREYPQLGANKCAEVLSDLIKTPYAAIATDDDFLITTFLEKAVIFLDHNPEFNAAWGKTIKIRLEPDDKAHGKIIRCKEIKLTSMGTTEKKASKRLLNSFNNDYFNPVHSLYRSESFKNMFQDYHLTGDIYQMGAYIINILTTISGKIKELDTLFLIRQDHTRRIRNSCISEQKASSVDQIYKPFFDKNTNPIWPEAYLYLKERLAHELQKQDGLTLAEAQKVAKQGFLLYVEQGLRKQVRQLQTQPDPSQNQLEKIEQFLKRKVRGLANKLTAPKKPVDLSLDSLLNPASPYHQDFLPAYQAITTPPELMD